MIPSLLSPHLAFVLAIAGAFAIYWELLAPGMILPGVSGLLLLVTGVSTLSQNNRTWCGAALILLGLVLVGVEIKAGTYMIAGLAGTAALGVGGMVLIRGPFAIAPALSFPLAAGFGAVSILLGRPAMRARHTKRIIGAEAMIDEVGYARTDINPEGTVILRGENWQARSSRSIGKGERVYVTDVRGKEVEVMPFSRPAA